MAQSDTLSIRLQMEGTAQIKSDLQSLGAEGERQLGRIGGAGEQASKKLQGEYGRLAQSLDPAVRAHAQLEKGTKTLDAALTTHLVNQQTHDRYVQLLAQHTAEFTGRLELNRRELVTLGRALIEARPGEAAVAFTRLATSAFGVSGGILAASAAALALPVAFVAAAEKSEAALRRVQVAITATGGASGVTVGQVEAIAEQVAGSSSLSTSAARSALTRFVGVGAPGALLPGATSLVPDLGRVVGSTDAAEKMLEQVFGDPAKAAKELAGRFDALSVVAVRHVEDLAQSGHAEDAQRAVLEALTARFGGLDEKAMTPFERAMTRATQAAVDFWERIGKPGRAPVTLEEQLAADQSRLASLWVPRPGQSLDTSAAARSGFAQFSVPTSSAFSDTQIAAAQRLVDLDKERITLERLVATQAAQEAQQDKLIRQGAELAGGFDSAAERTRKYSNEADALAGALSAALDRQTSLTKLLSDAPEIGNQTAAELHGLADLIRLLQEAAPAAAIVAKNQRGAADVELSALKDEHQALTANVADRERINAQLQIQRQYLADLANKDLATSAGALRDQRLANLGAKLGQPTADAIGELKGQADAERALAAAYDLGTEAGERQKITNEAHLAFLKGAIRDEGAYRDALLARSEAQTLANEAQKVADAIHRTGDLSRVASAAGAGPAAMEMASIMNAAHAAADPGIAGARNADELRQAQEYLQTLIEQGVAQANLDRQIRSTVEDRKSAQVLAEKQLELALMGQDATLRAQELADLRLRNELIDEGYQEGSQALEDEYQKRKLIADQIAATTVAIKQQQEVQKQNAEAMKSFASELGSAFERFVSATGSSHDKVKALEQDLAKILEKELIFKPFETNLQNLFSPAGQQQPQSGLFGMLLGWLGFGGSTSAAAGSGSSTPGGQLILAATDLGKTGAAGQIMDATGKLAGLPDIFKSLGTAIINVQSATINAGGAGVLSGGSGGGGGLLGSLFSSIFGGGGSDVIGGAAAAADPASFFGFAGLGFADGGVFDRGLRKFAGGDIFGSPTLFNIGMMGESGPESIMPLARMPGGQLGVHAGGGGGPTVYIDARGSDDPAAIERRLHAAMQSYFPGIVQKSVTASVEATFGMMKQGGRAAQISGKR